MTMTMNHSDPTVPLHIFTSQSHFLHMSKQQAGGELCFFNAPKYRTANQIWPTLSPSCRTKTVHEQVLAKLAFQLDK